MTEHGQTGEALHERTPEELAARRAEHRGVRRRVFGERVLALVLAACVLVAITLITTKKAPTTLLTVQGSGPGHLAAGSPNALSGNILVADENNNRLVVLSPHGQVAWKRRARQPSSVFLSPANHSIIVTERNASDILKIGVLNNKLTYRYGRVGRPGRSYNRLHTPQTAQQLTDGKLLVTDEGNCRILVLSPPRKRPYRMIGTTGRCAHDPPARLARPDSAFPTPDGGLVITELGSARIDLLRSNDTLIRALRVSGLPDPHDAYEFAPDKLIATSDARPGAIEEFSARGTVFWRYAPTGGQGELNRPLFAHVLLDGNILVCDSGNDRIIVIDRLTKKIVWQYGHDGVPGSGAGYLNTPSSAVVLT